MRPSLRDSRPSTTAHRHDARAVDANRQTASVDLNAYFISPDGDALTFSVETSNASVATASLAGSRMTVSAVGVGNATITATAMEASGMFSRQHLTAQINAGTVTAADSFGIALHFASDVSVLDQSIARSAVARWERALAKTVLPDVAVIAGEEACPGSGWGTWQQDTSIDDLLVLVSYDSIDGDGNDDGNTLARAGGCAWRDYYHDYLPFVGFVEIDEADPLSEMSLQEAEDLLNPRDRARLGVRDVLGLGWLAP